MEVGVSVQALDTLIPLCPPMQKEFALGKMIALGFGICELHLVHGAERGVARAQFSEFSEMLRVSGKALDKTAHKLDGVLVPPRGVDAESQPQGTTRDLTASTGLSHCVL